MKLALAFDQKVTTCRYILQLLLLAGWPLDDDLIDQLGPP